MRFWWFWGFGLLATLIGLALGWFPPMNSLIGYLMCASDETYKYIQTVHGPHPQYAYECVGPTGRFLTSTSDGIEKLWEFLPFLFGAIIAFPFWIPVMVVGTMIENRIRKRWREWFESKLPPKP